MSDPTPMHPAATTLSAVAGAVRASDLDAPTPCADFDVRALLRHLLFWGPSLVGAARKELVAPPAGEEADVALPDDWDRVLADHLRALAAAWDAPGAWEGSTRMGGPDELPASMIGAMVLGELVVHGWDLARATGQHPAWDEALLGRVHEELRGTAEMGREMGAYGPEVAVPADAPVLHRVLGLTGRDPGWSPAADPIT